MKLPILFKLLRSNLNYRKSWILDKKIRLHPNLILVRFYPSFLFTRVSNSITWRSRWRTTQRLKKMRKRDTQAVMKVLLNRSGAHIHGQPVSLTSQLRRLCTNFLSLRLELQQIPLFLIISLLKIKIVTPPPMNLKKIRMILI